MTQTNDIAGPVAPSKNDLCAALRAWVNQRPGLDFSNYGDVTSYRSELRGITRQRADALQMLRAVELRDSITAADMLAELQSNSRLFWDMEKSRLEYVTGQYWCTEYRRAAAAMLASVLWNFYRVHCMPLKASNPGFSAGEYIRRALRKEFGRGIGSRWFN